MGDIRIVWDPVNLRGDWRMAGAALEIGHDLETAILLSLFTDRQAAPDFTPTDGTTDRRGWWADIEETQDANGMGQIGSRLWQFARAKRNDDTLGQVCAAAREALQWLIGDGVASTIDIQAQWVGRSNLAMQVTVIEPNKPPTQFSYVWPQER